MGELTVRTPVRDYTGEIAGIAFADGEASFDPKEHPGALGYFVSAGYEVQGYDTSPEPPGRFEARPTPSAAAPGTPDNPTGIVGGVPPKDAAVEKDAGGPWSDAFLPPTNAGEADPHGPLVVSPGLHAVPPAPIRPGEVHVDDLPRQEAAETKLASEVLSEGRLVGDVVPTFEGPPAGPLGLSDPGSVDMGVREAERLRDEGLAKSAEQLADERDARGSTPARSARVADWRDFAVAQGMTREDADAATKDELVERYGG